MRLKRRYAGGRVDDAADVSDEGNGDALRDDANAGIADPLLEVVWALSTVPGLPLKRLCVDPCPALWAGSLRRFPIPQPGGL